MNYKFDIKIKMSHFDEVKNMFDRVSKDMEEWTGEKITIDSFVTLGTYTITSPSEVKSEDLEKMRKIIEEETQEKIKNKDIVVELRK